MTDSFIEQMARDARLEVSPFELMRAGIDAYVWIKPPGESDGSSSGPVMSSIAMAVNAVLERTRVITKQLIDAGVTEQPPEVGRVLATAINAHDDFKKKLRTFKVQDHD